MKKETINEITINYWIGGMIPLLILMPFLLELLKDLYFAIYQVPLSTFEVSIVFSFAVFLFTSIVVTSSLFKLKGQKEGCFALVHYFLFAAIYLLFVGYQLGRIVQLNVLLSILVACLLSGICLLLHFRFQKNIFGK